MTEFEAERDQPAGPDAVWAVVSDLGRLTEWLPAAVRVRPTDDGEVHAAVEDRGVDARGLVRVRPEQLRVEWGSRDGGDYAGYLQVMGDEPTDRSSVLLHLSFLGDQPETHGGRGAEEVRRWLDESLARLAALLDQAAPTS